ncbi:S26 family signal peptidase [Novosphingobium piscinae]|uniref:S26 family signal peptidase n=1 Tax=Novosphingobium piscinae TaxID=1507448 RepID=UPI0031B59892
MPRANRLLGLPAARRLLLWSGLGAGALALSALATFARGHALMINVSPSLPYWALWLERGRVPERGDIVLFDPPISPLVVRHFGARPKPFGKRVLGVPGDVVTEENRVFAINGTPVATAKRVSRLGEPLALGPTGRLPAGCYFVAGEHPDSFDSRYAAIGWICRPRVLGSGRPVL